MPFENFDQKWVDPYSQPCTFIWKHIIANHVFYATNDNVFNLVLIIFHIENIEIYHIVKVYIIINIETYAFNLSPSYLWLLFIQALPSMI